MSPANRAYLDMKYTSTHDARPELGRIHRREERLQLGPGGPHRRTGENIIGVEAPLWSETLVTIDDIEYMAFPRLPGYAEMGWSPQAAPDGRVPPAAGRAGSPPESPGGAFLRLPRCALALDSSGLAPVLGERRGHASERQRRSGRRRRPRGGRRSGFSR